MVNPFLLIIQYKIIFFGKSNILDRRVDVDKTYV